VNELGIYFSQSQRWPLLVVAGLVLFYMLRTVAWRRHALALLRVSAFKDAYDLPVNRWIKSWCQALGIVFAVIAALGPQWGQKEHSIKASGLDICLAIDLSRSMMAEDVAPNRLKGAKNQLSVFLNRLSGDRIGLVGFAGSAYVASPLTPDSDALLGFLEPMEPAFISDQSTNLATGVDACMTALGLDQVRDRNEIADFAAKVIVLLTDGEEQGEDVNGSVVRAERLGVPIYSMLVGTAQGGMIPSRNESGMGYVKDPSTGQNVITKLLDERPKELATKTGGQVFYLSQGVEAWKRFEEAIANYKRDNVNAGTKLDREERFQFPLLLAFLLLLIDFFLPETTLFRPKNGTKALVLLLALGATQSQAASQSPDPSLVYENNKGVGTFAAGDFAVAQKHFEQGLAEDASDPRLRLNWASNRLHMALPPAEKAGADPKAAAKPQVNKKVAEEALKELDRLAEKGPRDPAFRQALEFQRGIANQLLERKKEALASYYSAMALSKNAVIDEMAKNNIKQLLAEGGGGGGGGGSGEQGEKDKSEQPQDGEGEGDKPQNPQYGQGQQEPQFSGTDIDENQAQQILESVEAKERETQGKKARKDAKSGQNQGEDGDSQGRGRQW
jgi:Ca-activated chloride channel family protein